MPSVTLRNATDSFVYATQPSKNFGLATSVHMQSTSRYGYLYFNRAAPLGATITRATLRLYSTAAWSGTRTITVRRVAASWAQSRLTWNNRPGTTGTAVTVTDTGGPAGHVIEINVASLMQSVSNGAAWYGFRIETDDAAFRAVVSTQGVSSLRPTLEVAWTEAPDAPTTLSPSGNRAVSMSKPLLGFDFTDELGDTSLDAVQVQIDAAANWTTPAFDSGWVTTSVPELDLSTTAYAGLANNASTYWRVRVRDGAGLMSPWSDDEQFKRVDFAAVTINNPPADFVTESTPPIIWSFAGVQKAWQVVIRDSANPSRIIADSGKRTGTETSWTVPAGKLVERSVPYVLSVRIWDNISREANGVAIYALASKTFDVRADATTDPVTALTIAQQGALPRMRLAWTRSLAPDSFVVRRDGKVIEDELLPADALVEGTSTSYIFDDDDAQAWRAHTWQVNAKVNGKESPATSVTATPKQRGIWLLDKGRNLSVWIAGQEAGTFALGEEASVFVPIGATKVVRRVQGQRGYEGSLGGPLVDKYGRTAAAYEADLLKMRDQPSRPVTLTLGDLTIKVILGNITTYPTAHTPPVRMASFEFWETT